MGGTNTFADGRMRFSSISKRIARRARFTCRLAGFFARKISIRLIDMGCILAFGGTGFALIGKPTVDHDEIVLGQRTHRSFQFQGIHDVVVPA